MFCKSSSIHKLLFSSACALLITAASHAVVFTEWTFNSSNTTPSTGAGTITALGGVATSFASDSGDGGSSDPASSGQAINTTTYPTTTAASGTAGLRFDVSTVGYNSITIEFDNRNSNTGSRYIRFDYTLDGTNFVNGSTAAGTIFTTNNDAAITWFNNRTVNLSSIAGAANNVKFGFRLVVVVDPTSGNYVAANGAQTFGAAGTIRYDMVQVSGTLVPEPGAWAAVATGLVGLVGLKRRK